MRKKLEEDIAALEKQHDSLPKMTEEQKRITSETLKKKTEELKAIQSQRAYETEMTRDAEKAWDAIVLTTNKAGLHRTQAESKYKSLKRGYNVTRHVDMMLRC